MKYYACFSFVVHLFCCMQRLTKEGSGVSWLLRTVQSTGQQSTGPFLRCKAEMCWQAAFMETQLTSWQKNIRCWDFPIGNKLPVTRPSRFVQIRGRAEVVVLLTRKVTWAHPGQAFVLMIIDMKGAGLKKANHHANNQTLQLSLSDGFSSPLRCLWWFLIITQSPGAGAQGQNSR